MRLLLSTYDQPFQVEEWVPVDGCKREDLEAIFQLFKDSYGGTVLVKDSEGFFKYSSELVDKKDVNFEELSYVITMVDLYGEAFTHWATAYHPSNWGSFCNSYYGNFDSLEAFGECKASYGSESLPFKYHPYFDFQKYAEDLIKSGSYYVYPGITEGIFVFVGPINYHE
jgi:hypothetical protein